MKKTVLFEGIDISSHNGVVDIKRVRDSGIKMVAIRAGYGKNNVDQRYIANAQACYNLNMPTMIYWFSYGYAVDMAAKEAEYAIAQAKKYWDVLPIAFDLEYDTHRYARTKGVEISRQLATDMAIAFLKKVKAAGCIPVLYTNNDYTKNYFDIERIVQALGMVYIWYARYNVSSLTDSEENLADIWQYTSKGRVDGVSGNVDLNRFYSEIELTPVKTEKPVVTKNINIENFQKASTADGYKDQNGKALVIDGLDGPKTQYVRKQITLKAKWTVLGYKTGSKGSTVKWVQTRCNEILGTSIKVDGQYGKDTRNAVREVQKKLNLAVDGIAGYNTLQALFYN